MKILVISNMYPSKKYPHYGVFVSNFIHNLNIPIDSIALTYQKNAVLRFIYYSLFFGKVFFKILFFSKKYNFIYIHFPKQILMLFSLFPSDIVNKLILNFHGSDIQYSGIEKIYLPINKKIVDNSRLVVVPSDYFKNQVSDFFSITKDKIFVSPSAGIDNDIFFPRTNFSEKKVICFIGRLSEDKGLNLLIESMSLVPNDIICKVIGSGDIDFYHNLALSFKVQDRIQFLGVQNQEYLPVMMKGVDLFVFPSKRKAESLGLTPIEAMSCGLPVIAYSNGAVHEYLNEFNALIFNQFNATELASAIVQFYNLPFGKRLAMSNASIKRASRFNRRSIMSSLRSQILSLK